MDPAASSTPLTIAVSPWSEHPLQITTAEHLYQSGNTLAAKNNSATKWLKAVGPPLPRHRHSSSMISSPSGDIYIFGGVVGNQYKNDTWSIRLAEGPELPSESEGGPTHVKVTASLVETSGEAPSPRMGCQSALTDGFLVLWGGITPTNGEPEFVDKCIYLLNISTRHWTKLPIRPAPSARVWHAACMCGDKFVVFGGVNKRSGTLNDLWSFDLLSLAQRTPKWEQIENSPDSPCPTGRRGSTLVAHRERLYMFGGKRGTDFYNDIWCFDMATRAWTGLESTGDIPRSRAYHAASLVGDTVYIFGGSGDDSSELEDAYSFKINEQRWYRIPRMSSQPSARSGHIMAAVQGRVYVIGGDGTGLKQPEYTKLVHILDTALDLIKYPEHEREIQPSSNSHTEELPPTPAENDNLGRCTPEVCLEEIDSTPRPSMITATSQDTITGAMSAAEILRYLVIHGCRDISKDLDTWRVSEVPVSTGGFGDVYCGTLPSGDRVALKCLRMLVGSTEQGRKFLKHAAHELYVWSKCSHPNILELHGVMLFREQVAMISPWVEHGHLRWFLSQNTQADRRALCVSISDGVDYLHKRGIVHGDLKPDNILVAKDHTPKLTDFGNAVLSEYTLQFSGSNTSPGMSLRWTAPEILNAETKTTQASDVYALGMIIFEVITGILPYAGARDPLILRNILAGKVPSRPEAHIPVGVEQADQLWSLITSCWAYNPLGRPAASEVKAVMDAITLEGLAPFRS